MSGFTYDVIIIGGGWPAARWRGSWPATAPALRCWSAPRMSAPGPPRPTAALSTPGSTPRPGPPRRASTCWATGRWARWPASSTLNSRAAARWCSALTRRPPAPGGAGGARAAKRRSGAGNFARRRGPPPRADGQRALRGGALGADRRHRLPVRAHDRLGRERLRQRRDLFAADRGHGHRAHGGRLPRGDRPRRADGPLRRQCGRGLCRCAAQPGQRPQAAHHAAQGGLLPAGQNGGRPCAQHHLPAAGGGRQGRAW